MIFVGLIVLTMVVGALWTYLPLKHFESALKNNEIEDFLSGKGRYFILDREWGTHWHYESYKRYIQPYLSRNNEVLPIKFWESVTVALESNSDKLGFLNDLLAYLGIYYNSANYYADEAIISRRSCETPAWFIEKISKFVSDNKDLLLLNQRPNLNDAEGMDGVIIRKLMLIKKRGGPDFIPKHDL